MACWRSTICELEQGTHERYLEKKKKTRVLMKYCFPYLLISKLDFRRTTPGESVSSIITLS